MLHDWRGPPTPAATDAGRVDVFGCPVDAVTLRQAVEAVSGWVEARDRPRLGLAVNAAKVEGMRRNAVLRATAARADLVIADGAGVLWAARASGTPLPERVTGVGLCSALLRRAAKRGWRPYLLGARPDVSTALRQRMARWGVELAGARDGHWAPLEEAAVAAAIAAARPDLLFVALGSPRQEGFLLRWRDELAVPWAMGVGGSFDVLAGRVRRAPQAWQEAGLEWAWRLSSEPHRIPTRRTARAVRFAARIAARGLGLERS